MSSTLRKTPKIFCSLFARVFLSHQTNVAFLGMPWHGLGIQTCPSKNLSCEEDTKSNQMKKGKLNYQVLSLPYKRDRVTSQFDSLAQMILPYKLFWCCCISSITQHLGSLQIVLNLFPKQLLLIHYGHKQPTNIYLREYINGTFNCLSQYVAVLLV